MIILIIIQKFGIYTILTIKAIYFIFISYKLYLHLANTNSLFFLAGTSKIYY